MSSEKTHKTHNFGGLTVSFTEINGIELTGSTCSLMSGTEEIAQVSGGGYQGGPLDQHEQRRANAERIALCVNYCRFLSNEKLLNELPLKHHHLKAGGKH